VRESLVAISRGLFAFELFNVDCRILRHLRRLKSEKKKKCRLKRSKEEEK
jgi:hypothetical protein